MEAFGYLFGMIGMFFAIIAWGQIGSLRNEFNRLKNELKSSGTLVNSNLSDENF